MDKKTLTIAVKEIEGMKKKANKIILKNYF